ncbi:MAG: phosphotransferase [Chloroflexi bacterium]|nr:phosphotransferase [Chloroflexota bacterium]MCC6897261.1 phosphotransferase [Anaerolineae bacterium]
MVGVNKQVEYAETVQAVYPQLDIQTAVYREGGQYNAILIVNDRFIFRFPRYAEAAASLATETAILHAIYGKLPLETPNPVYVHFGDPTPQHNFVGYPMITGEAINIYGISTMFDAAACQRLADQLADFLKALHALPSGLSPARVTNSDKQAYWADFYARVRAKLFPHMSSAGRQEVISHFESYLADSRNFNYTPVLRHGDFGTGNILFDRASGLFTGVIDFGSAALGDAAVDLSAIYGWRGRGETLARRMFSRYPELEAMLPRAQFYAGTFLLQEALFGVENDQPDLIKSGLEPYV